MRCLGLVVLTGLMASCQTQLQIVQPQNVSPPNSQTQRLQAASPIPSQINQLYVFGDSLSDSGNVFRETEGAYPPTPPYFQGRYSNGLVWVEQLSKKLGLRTEQTENFAYGGATTANYRENGIPGVLAQVQNFIETHPQGDPTALYVVWVGANDYLSGENNSKPVVENITTAINLLAKTGAEKFLVANLPDLGRLPATRNRASAAALSRTTQAHNAALAQALKSLNQTLGADTQVFTLDVSGLYRDAIASPSQFGLTNVTNGCLNTPTCTQPNEFLFWDGIHPTTRTHQILADTAFSLLQKAAQVSSSP
ncbi:SGNH/GDSL hydrolase family protein [Myxacorys almedinensis]|nr:SGNH/GDSL hydrolase family protein [Myxacorys almedinensis]